jgi:hypothetical protein
MASLAEDLSWYTQFKRAAEGSQPSLHTSRAVTSAKAKTGILKQLLQLIFRVKVETRTENVPLTNISENNELGNANRELDLKLLEWSRSKTSLNA